MSSPLETRNIMHPLASGIYHLFVETWNSMDGTFVDRRDTGRFFEKTGTVPEADVVENPDIIMSGIYLYDPYTKEFMLFEEIH